MTPDGPISGIRLSDAYLLDQRAVAVGEQLKAGGLLCHLQQGLFEFESQIQFAGNSVSLVRVHLGGLSTGRLYHTNLLVWVPPGLGGWVII